MRRWIILAAAMLTTAAASRPPMPAWLAGCWSERKATRWTEECWKRPQRDTMIGSGRSGTGKTPGSWERMRIDRSGDGSLVFQASEQGAEAVGFPATSVSAREIVFANPAHDYPQRIHYWRDGAYLRAEISMTDGSKTVSWRYRRR